MSKREPTAYYIVPEYRRDTRKSVETRGGYWSKRVRYAIRKISFEPWCNSGIITDLDGDLSLRQAKRKLKSWRAWDRKHK